MKQIDENPENLQEEYWPAESHKQIRQEHLADLCGTALIPGHWYWKLAGIIVYHLGALSADADLRVTMLVRMVFSFLSDNKKPGDLWIRKN